MGEAFLKIKRKYLLAAILKSAVIGVACGLFAVGTLLLALKLSAVALAAGVYVLIGIGGALLAGGVSFLLLRPTDAKVARRLDTEYDLRERVQTALAYAQQSGELYELQREDTRATLRALQLKKPTFKQIWQYVFVGVTSLALLLTAALLPMRINASGESGAPPPPAWEELPFAVSAFQLARIEGLKEDVAGFPLGDSLKEQITGSLETLVTELKGAQSNGDMKGAVRSAVQSVDNACKAESSYFKLGSSLKNLARVDLAKVIAAGAETYRDVPMTSSKAVKDFYGARLDTTDTAIEEYLTDFTAHIKSAFTHDPAAASGILSGIHMGIILSNVSGSDALYLKLNDLTLLLDALLPEAIEAEPVYEGEGAEMHEVFTPAQRALMEKIDAAMGTFAYGLSDLLAEQSFRFAADAFVYASILDILGLSEEEYALPIGWNLLRQLGDEGGTDGGDDKTNSGGYGDGNVEYGSDDLIYDPDTGEYVPYGQLINKYYAIVNELLLEGRLTEEQANIIRAYFEMLLSGIKGES